MGMALLLSVGAVSAKEKATALDVMPGPTSMSPQEAALAADPKTGAPEPTRFESPFGRYIRTIAATETGYEVERGVAFTPIMVPPEEYPALRAFLDQVRQADRVPLEFERKP